MKGKIYFFKAAMKSLPDAKTTEYYSIEARYEEPVLGHEEGIKLVEYVFYFKKDESQARWEHYKTLITEFK